MQTPHFAIVFTADDVQIAHFAETVDGQVHKTFIGLWHVTKQDGYAKPLIAGSNCLFTNYDNWVLQCAYVANQWLAEGIGTTV